MFRIAEDHHIILLPWMTVLSHPDITTLEALFPETPEGRRHPGLQKLIDLGAIVEVPEAE